MINIICQQCEERFDTWPYNIRNGNGKFCGRKCYIEAMKTEGHINKGRFKKAHKQSNTGKTHFKEGHKSWLDGLEPEKHPGWKGGKTSYTQRLLSTKRWKEWREAVFERDIYACRKCGAASGEGKTVYLQAHHCTFPVRKLAKTIFEKYLFDIRNGITLCRECHSRLPKK